MQFLSTACNYQYFVIGRITNFTCQNTKSRRTNTKSIKRADWSTNSQSQLTCINGIILICSSSSCILCRLIAMCFFICSTDSGDMVRDAPPTQHYKRYQHKIITQTNIHATAMIFSRRFMDTTPQREKTTQSYEKSPVSKTHLVIIMLYATNYW